MNQPKFPLGQTVATPNALEHLSQVDVVLGLARHQAGDWGELCEEDRNHNDQALAEGSRLLSVYHTSHGVKFWIITEWDRSVTTVLLPEDY